MSKQEVSKEVVSKQVVFEQQADSLIRDLSALLLNGNMQVVTAESCTGGAIAQAMTAVPGSSRWCWGGVVSYANEAKSRLLGVPESLIEIHGAVSQPVVEAMALGAIEQSGADIAVAVSGIAGPDGGSREKPVGTVWLGWGGGNTPVSSQCFLFDGDRRQVRQQATLAALQGLINRLGRQSEGSV